MSRFTIAFFLLSVLTPENAGAEELFLRVNAVGFRETSNERPGQKLLESLEIMIRPGTSFYGRTRAGKSTLTVLGNCKLADNPEVFNVELQIVSRVGTGEFIHTENGNGKEIVNRTSANTVIRVPLGKEIIVGGFQTSQDQKRDDGSTRRSRSELTMKVSLIERNIEEDDEP